MKLIGRDKALQEQCAELMLRVSWHGDYFSANCPFHNDTSPSCMVWSDGFRCKSCGAGGSLKRLYTHLSSKIPTSRPQKYSNKKLGIPRWSYWLEQYGSYDDAAVAAHQSVLNMPSLIGYLRKRKVAEFWKIGRFGYIDGWLSFPVLDRDGSMVDWTLRAHPNKNITTRYVVRPRLSKNEPHHLYVPDWKRIDTHDIVYCCFGIIDAWALHAVGLASCTGISGKDIDARLLDDIRKRIIVIPDYNEDSNAVSLVSKLGWRGRIFRPEYPPDCKDPSDVLTKFDGTVLLDILNFPQSYSSHIAV